MGTVQGRSVGQARPPPQLPVWVLNCQDLCQITLNREEWGRHLMPVCPLGTGTTHTGQRPLARPAQQISMTSQTPWLLTQLSLTALTSHRELGLSPPAGLAMIARLMAEKIFIHLVAESCPPCRREGGTPRHPPLLFTYQTMETRNYPRHPPQLQRDHSS